MPLLVFSHCCVPAQVVFVALREINMSTQKSNMHKAKLSYIFTWHQHKCVEMIREENLGQG